VVDVVEKALNVEEEDAAVKACLLRRLDVVQQRETSI
jgi:hypothetical protein